jgi:Ca-activated chloride channel family protein
MTVKVSAKYDNFLVRPDGSERYLLFKITGEANQSAPRVPLNLSLILDRSGSMASENKLELVKQAAAFVVEHLSEQDRINVVAYDDSIWVVARSSKATSANRQDIVRQIRRITTGGSTNLSEGWLTGCREVAEFQSEARYIDCAWLLTDGLANVGIVNQEELATHAAELRKRGISTTTFGVGLDFNEELLRAMAEKGGGNFYFIDSSRQIKNYFEGELGERLTTVARNIALQIQFPDGVSLENINEYEASRTGNRLTLYLGDVYAGEEKLVLVKVKTPARSVGTTLNLKALLMFTNALSGEGREIQAGEDLALRYATDPECDAQVVDASLKDIIGKLLVAKAKREILEANRTGDYDRVRMTTGALRFNLNQAGVADTAVMQQALEEAEAFGAQAEVPLEEKLRKSQHYSTHSVQRSRRDYKKAEDQP